MNLKEIFVIDNNLFVICIFVVVLLSLFFLFKNKLKPGFVVPENNIKSTNDFLQKFLIGGIIVFCFLIILNISYLKSKNIEVENKLNIQILYDVSLSTAANDIVPSRFDAGKSALMKLVQSLPGYNFSLITFSGIPFVWIPFSANTNAINDKLNNMNLSQFPPLKNFVGTAIGDAIYLGIDNLLKNSDNTKYPGIIILITDGDSNIGSEPLQAANYAKSKNIPIYTLGVGDSNFVIGTTHKGEMVYTSINIDLLQKISSNSYGEFYRVLSNEDFKGIFQNILNYVKSQEKEKVVYNYVEINKYLYIILAIFLLGYLSIRVYILIAFLKNKDK